MDATKVKWDFLFSESMNNDIIYDLWLDKYIGQLKINEKPVLDLGCGSGNNTKYLLEKGISIVSCDYSAVSLKKIRKYLPQAHTVLHDIRDPLPFTDNSFRAVIADLSLHYFSWEKTKEIFCEICRVLENDGLFAFRVNSIKDSNWRAGKGKEIEKNYYRYLGENKRFFEKAARAKCFYERNIMIASVILAHPYDKSFNLYGFNSPQLCCGFGMM